MGEIAEGMINGFQCSHCGVCFEQEHGYPVLCTDCYEKQRLAPETPRARARVRGGLPRATEKEL